MTKPKVPFKNTPKNISKKLKGNQKKLDANKNNRIDKQDFVLLRKKPKKTLLG